MDKHCISVYLYLQLYLHVLPHLHVLPQCLRTNYGQEQSLNACLVTQVIVDMTSDHTEIHDFVTEKL